MILLGLILLGATGAFTGLLIADNLSGGPDYTVTILGNDIATMNSLAIFLAGIALALVFCLGAALALGGGTRRRRHAGARHRAHAETRQAVAERDALQDRLDRSEDRPTEQYATKQYATEQSAGQAPWPSDQTAARASTDTRGREPATADEPPTWTTPTHEHARVEDTGAEHDGAPDSEADALPSRRRW